jgi:hypothetical protein
VLVLRRGRPEMYTTQVERDRADQYAHFLEDLDLG